MHYVVDQTNRIIAVDDGWDDAAALAQGGLGSMRASVMGRQLEDCMVGDATKMFVRTALDAARLLQQTRVLPYRCDAPDARRRFDMIISPIGGGQVKVEHRLVEAYPAAVRNKRPRRQGLAGWRCSQCLHVRLGGSDEWTDIDIEPQTILAQDVCPSCASNLFSSATSGPHP
ncbi:MAG: hypothetical protein Q7U28_10615 [Aquabacterium sp.]|nr:hypothetical protein [Aquabacterium sp.]